ncbi:MAG: hypothetical protein ACXQT5_04905 [Candidatus Syntropharchaeia archaeon]
MCVSLVQSLNSRIEKEPVGVKYTVCGGILQASNGEIIELSEDKCACFGGKRHLGLTEKGKTPCKMLVEGEKLWFDLKTAIRSGTETERIAVSGNFNLSVGDITARRMEGWDPNIMVASIPWERIRGIADAIDLSTAGLARLSEKFERLTERMVSRR